MFTKKDIELKSIFVINCFDKKYLRVKNGELLLEDSASGKTLTKFPFQKLLALFIIGNATITTPLIEKCRKYGVYISVMKMSLRPVFTYGFSAEANYLLRERQYLHDKESISESKVIIYSKISNQLKLLQNTKKKDELTSGAIETCKTGLELLPTITNYQELMGVEGWVSKAFFKAYYSEFDWCGRVPRAKTDVLNVTLDIGYTVLFNFIETITSMFGFDNYCGVYHRLWFKRKSLICDLMEPFRCLIDQQVRKSFNKKQFSSNDFEKYKSEYYLKHDKSGDYYKVFFSCLIEHKLDVFMYVRKYYRAFMSGGSKEYPKYLI